MIRRVLVLVTVLLFALIFCRLIGSYTELQELRPLALHYVMQGPAELGAPNIVTGILITYRGFDTLGEVAVLFMVAASVGVLLKNESTAGAAAVDDDCDPRREAGEVVRTGKQVLLPMILTFGAYVIVNGHLSAGGGFQGGAIVASGGMMMMLARPGAALNVALLGVIESLAGVFYVCIGILGLVLAGGFLDARFLPRGEFGAFFSAGAIPLISALLGIKVGAELSVIIDRFRS
ncbi:hydrogen gas-evolving membrane-bound hydrogenase subunit E [Paraburkholderia sp. BL10I2N1]|uniref:hydrogen gas-evolving membrane-bound hydrogenase subunit E n=1 Tax=Paraburkholderia sp. BL10I2N1 TaxID=1938796 RepID=UPI00105CB5C8|nr:hydrogen gas-evolving membrane-bound hydrogenase subunit E [Paraburkholderia sp. BL10I2N1]TDN61612.1 multicomponent Na+:H+ antiporter subunit B [Paraburkholderia sp. BL10I2N1]